MNRPNVEALAARAIEIEEPDYFSCATIALATYVQALEAERDALRADAERWQFCEDICHNLSDERGDFLVVSLRRPEVMPLYRSTAEVFRHLIDAEMSRDIHAKDAQS